jgi:uncharacterized protein (TIGR01244 family)
MKYVKRIIPVFALASALAMAGPAEVPAAVDGIAGYKLVHSGLAAAGVPSAEALATLKARGFKTVIDLRGVTEPGVAEEEAIVRTQGLRYVHVPVSASTFSLGDVETVARVLDDAQAAPVLLHCASSNRVGAVLAVIQVQKGMSLEAAEAEGRKFGLKSEAMVEAMKRVAAEAGRAGKR